MGLLIYLVYNVISLFRAKMGNLVFFIPSHSHQAILMLFPILTGEYVRKIPTKTRLHSI